MKSLLLSPRSLVLFTCFSLLTLTGCQIFALAARAMPKIVPAAYPGLPGKTVAVMVWAERPIQIDYPNMQADITAGLQKKLVAAQKNEKPDELKLTTFPVTWQSMVRYQSTHPDAASLPITEIAREVGVQRLIYIEIADFQTRSSLTPELFRGQITVNMKVIELEDGQTRTGYIENGIVAKFPPKGPDDGVLNLGDQRTYVGTLDQLTGKLAWKFYKHEEERQPGE